MNDKTLEHLIDLLLYINRFKLHKTLKIKFKNTLMENTCLILKEGQWEIIYDAKVSILTEKNILEILKKNHINPFSLINLLENKVLDINHYARLIQTEANFLLGEERVSQENLKQDLLVEAIISGQDLKAIEYKNKAPTKKHKLSIIKE